MVLFRLLSGASQKSYLRDTCETHKFTNIKAISCLLHLGQGNLI